MLKCIIKKKRHERYELDAFGSEYDPLGRSFDGHYEIPGKVISSDYSMYLSS
jgi:hypothetical protein